MEAGEDVRVVPLRLGDGGVGRDDASLLQERLDVGAQVGAQRGLPGAEVLLRADGGDRRVKVSTRAVTAAAASALIPVRVGAWRARGSRRAS